MKSLINFILLFCSVFFDSCNSFSNNNQKQTGVSLKDSLSADSSLVSKMVSIDSEKVHFCRTISTYDPYADSDGYKVYYTPDSIYLFYRFGGSWEKSYECNVYPYPLTDSFTGPYTIYLYYSHLKFFKGIKEISKIKDVKTPKYINDYNKPDSETVNPYLNGKDILQMADIDKNNILVLIRDTASYNACIIWYSRIEKGAELLRIDWKTQGTAMLFADLNGDGQLDLIINQSNSWDSHMGNFESDFYILHLDRPMLNAKTVNK